MSEIFYSSDQHFFHSNVIKFADETGNRYRPFDSIEEMHETIIDNHNRLVSKRDITYFLGDVSFNRKGLPLLSRMNGQKVLILGNHDTFELSEYLKYFSSIHAILKKHNCVLTHVPVHPSQLDSRWKLNIHGHLHSQTVMTLDNLPDERYYNVSIEVTNATPVPFDVIKEQRKKLLDL